MAKGWTKFMQKTHYKEIDIAKGFGIILVLIGHAFPDSLNTLTLSNPVAK